MEDGEVSVRRILLRRRSFVNEKGTHGSDQSPIGHHSYDPLRYTPFFSDGNNR